MQAEVHGRVVRGLRAASGASRVMRRGTIALQLPHFRRALTDFDTMFDGRLHIGTLNVHVPGHVVEVRTPAFHLKDVAWERGTTENFYLSPCVLRFSGRDYRGLIYIPDPATKPKGLPVGQYLEILTMRVPFIRYGSRVKLTIDAEAVSLVPMRARSASLLAQKRPPLRSPRDKHQSGRLSHAGLVAR